MITPVPQKGIVLYDSNHQKHVFPVVRDSEVGIHMHFQACLISSVRFFLMKHNDDDRKTTSTQFQMGVSQTMNDLADLVKGNKS